MCDFPQTLRYVNQFSLASHSLMNEIFSILEKQQARYLNPRTQLHLQDDNGIFNSDFLYAAQSIDGGILILKHSKNFIEEVRVWYFLLMRIDLHKIFIFNLMLKEPCVSFKYCYRIF